LASVSRASQILPVREVGPKQRLKKAAMVRDL